MVAVGPRSAAHDNQLSIHIWSHVRSTRSFSWLDKSRPRPEVDVKVVPDDPESLIECGEMHYQKSPILKAGCWNAKQTPCIQMSHVEACWDNCKVLVISMAL